MLRSADRKAAYVCTVWQLRVAEPGLMNLPSRVNSLEHVHETGNGSKGFKVIICLQLSKYAAPQAAQ